MPQQQTYWLHIPSIILCQSSWITWKSYQVFDELRLHVACCSAGSAAARLDGKMECRWDKKWWVHHHDGRWWLDRASPCIFSTEDQRFDRDFYSTHEIPALMRAILWQSYNLGGAWQRVYTGFRKRKKSREPGLYLMDQESCEMRPKSSDNHVYVMFISTDGMYAACIL